MAKKVGMHENRLVMLTLLAGHYMSRLIPKKVFEKLLWFFINARTYGEKPNEALTLLLSIDNILYRIIGRHSARYDDGEHAKHRLTGYVSHFVAKALESGGPYLDVGCGTGHLAIRLASETKMNVDAVDTSAQAIDVARELNTRGNLKFRKGDVFKSDLGQMYRTIILSNVLEHIEDRVGFLSALCERFSPRYLLIRVPNFERDWRVPLKKELKIDHRLDPTHEIEHTKKEITCELINARLDILSLEEKWGEFWIMASPNGAPVGIQR